MMKRAFVVLAIVGFAALAPPAAAIDINSTIEDWDAAGLLHSEVIHGGGGMDLQRWGVTVDGGYLYAIMENSGPITAPRDYYVDL